MSIDAVKNNYTAIVAALIDLIDDGGHRSIDARRLLAAIQEPLFLVSLFILHGLLGPIKVLSNQLTGKLTSILNSADSSLFS